MKTKVAPIVEEVLKVRYKARNSDNDLLACVWYKLGLKLTKEQYEMLMTMPSAESITRVRRKLQEQGKYVADQKIKQAREQKSMVVQQNAPTANTNTMERILTEK